MKILDHILNSELFLHQPPVLVDIGASGEINDKWKPIARYSICLAFDADVREFQISEQMNKTYKKLYSFNRIVTAEATDHPNFYLTSSPFCSSLLEPDLEKLAPWSFRPLFEITSLTRLPAVTIQECLMQVGINHIDWFKADTQGTDLRLFKSLSKYVQQNILVAEFEPGILDAYKKEDKLYMVMQEMQQLDFWLSSMKVKGTQRLNSDYADKIGQYTTERIIKTSPGWAELTYLRQPSMTERRELLLLYVFAILEDQFGFALEVADFAIRLYSDVIFQDCKKAALKKINAEKMKLPLVLLKRKINNLFRNIHA